MKGFRNFVKVPEETIINFCESVVDNAYVIKYGNKYSLVIKIFVGAKERYKGILAVYAIAKVEDPNSKNRKYLPATYYMNPAYIENSIRRV